MNLGIHRNKPNIQIINKKNAHVPKWLKLTG